MQLTLQIYQDSTWQDAAELVLEQPEKGRRSSVELAYRQDYGLDWFSLSSVGDVHACSVHLPVDCVASYRQANQWFGFMDDIVPSGAARRYWVRHLGLEGMSEGAQDATLLRKGAIAPVGNMRVKEAVPNHVTGSQLPNLRFPQYDVVERNSDFLEYAQQSGAASGGATGAGGEAPKLLIREGKNKEVWIDTWQDDAFCRDQHYLVKFPRNKMGDNDCDILRAEYHYFSIMKAAPGKYLNHFNILETLVDLFSRYSIEALHKDMDIQALVVEWLKRDMLNIAFGNSDNHGRNTAVLKTEGSLSLAPIYDFAPMKADSEAVSRTTTWGVPFEEGGRFNWQRIASHLEELLEGRVKAVSLLEELNSLAIQLMGLKHRLAERGVPASILNMPTMGFDFLDKKIEDWGLL